MATQGEAAPAADSRGGEPRHRSAALSAELIAILAVGVTLAGVMLTMPGEVRDEVRVIREEVRVIRDGQIDIRERLARVEAKVDVLAGDWPPKRNSGSIE